MLSKGFRNRKLALSGRLNHAHIRYVAIYGGAIAPSSSEICNVKPDETRNQNVARLLGRRRRHVGHLGIELARAPVIENKSAKAALYPDDGASGSRRGPDREGSEGPLTTHVRARTSARHPLRRALFVSLQLGQKHVRRPSIGFRRRHISTTACNRPYSTPLHPSPTPL